MNITTHEQTVLDEAAVIMTHVLKKSHNLFSSNADVCGYLSIKVGLLEREVFGVLYLDINNRLIEDKIMFEGTLATCPMYPREVMRKALLVNAASVIVYHNHPSGKAVPTDADLKMTKEIKRIFASLDLRVLDHIIVAGLDSYSFMEHGDL